MTGTASHLLHASLVLAFACSDSMEHASTTGAIPRQQPVTAVLRVSDVAAAIAAYREVLGAEVRLVLTARDGRIEHVELELEHVVIWIDRADRDPRGLGGTSGYLEAPFARVPLGRPGWEPRGMLWRDPFGQLWRPAARVRPVLALAPGADPGFYSRAFPDRRIGHDAPEVALVPPAPPALTAPAALGDAPFRVHLYVARCDDTVARAVGTGGVVRAAPALAPWGDRWAMIEDPSGHTWGIGERVETLTQAAIQARLE